MVLTSRLAKIEVEIKGTSLDRLDGECPFISASRFASASEQMPVRALYLIKTEVG